jgi:hypothetical protein
LPEGNCLLSRTLEADLGVTDDFPTSQ